MTTSLSLNASVSFQPSDASKPAPVPIVISQLQYSQAVMLSLVFTTPQTNTMIGDGTVTAPKYVYLEVVTGEVDISTSSSGLNPIKVVANPTPAPGDVAAFMLIYTQGTTAPFYVTTPGPATARLWLLQ